MKIGERFFADTNILIYAAQIDDVRHSVCRALLSEPAGSAICISPQILAEFYYAVTSAKRVAAPVTAVAAIGFMDILLSYEHITVLPMLEEVRVLWISMLGKRELRGRRVFDLQIAATMLANGVNKIATYNAADFRSIEGIEVLEPESLVSTS